MLNPTDPLDSLLARLVEDTLCPEDLALLEQRLREDPLARKRYLHYLDLHAELETAPDLASLREGSSLPPPSQSLSASLDPSAPWRLWIGAAACGVFGMLFASVAWAYAAPKLREKWNPPIALLNEGFESIHAPLGLGLPSGTRFWSGDDAQVVPAESGISPKSGQSMLKFLRPTYAGENAPSSAWGDVYRLVKWPELPPHVKGRLRLTASFAAAPSADSDQYAMSAELICLDQDPSETTGLRSLSALQRSSHALTSKMLPMPRDGSWRDISVSADLTPQTHYVLIHVAMVRRFPKPSPEPFAFSAHYLDDLKLEFIPTSDPRLSPSL